MALVPVTQAGLAIEVAHGSDLVHGGTPVGAEAARLGMGLGLVQAMGQVGQGGLEDGQAGGAEGDGHGVSPVRREGQEGRMLLACATLCWCGAYGHHMTINEAKIYNQASLSSLPCPPL